MTVEEMFISSMLCDLCSWLEIDFAGGDTLQLFTGSLCAVFVLWAAVTSAQPAQGGRSGQTAATPGSTPTASASASLQIGRAHD